MPLAELVSRAWRCDEGTTLLMQELHETTGVDGERVQCEANVTRLDAESLVVVTRDISERFMRFESEKRVVSEMTAREKDAEANRFTRHEVKNGLLAAIGLCDSLKETTLDSIEKALVNSSRVEEGKLTMIRGDISRSITELNVNLHEILDTILAEAMARDVIHEVYELKRERVDIVELLVSMMGFHKGSRMQDRFPIVTRPSPLPAFSFDPQLLKHIHRNAVSNACKYGKKGGLVTTEVIYHQEDHILEFNVINLPGENYDAILQMGDEAGDMVFEAGQRLHSKFQDSRNASSGEVFHSSGDGAWIMRKCAKTLEGTCSILFEPERTVFSLRCPATPYSAALRRQTSMEPSEFHCPRNTWGIGLDDSKIQRKLLFRMFQMAGVSTDRIKVFGEDENEIRQFQDFMIEFIDLHSSDYFFLIIDENLDMVSDEAHYSTISGSMCVQAIRRRLIPEHERQMLAVIRSANDSSHDTAVYNSRAHGCLPKSPLKKEPFLETLAPIWSNRFTLNSDLEKSFKVRSRHSREMFGAFAEEGFVQTSELMDTIQSIDRLAAGIEIVPDSWQKIWEKLHILKGDILTLEDTTTVNEAVETINEMRGVVVPDSFAEKWSTLRQAVLSI